MHVVDNSQENLKYEVVVNDLQNSWESGYETSCFEESSRHFLLPRPDEAREGSFPD